MSFAQKIIKQLITTPPSSRDDILAVERRLAHAEPGALFPTTMELLKVYHDLLETKKIIQNKTLEGLLQKHPMRTLSGVAIITVLARPYPCPGKCSYCPTEVRMPKSYLEKEPAAWRGLILRFDPYTQMRSRIETLTANGHPTDKIELIVKGGTWSAYPAVYQRWFLKRCFDGANDAGSDIKPEEYTTILTKSKDQVAPAEEPGTRLEKEHRQVANTDGWVDAVPTTDEEIESTHKTNERGAHRIIGITLETRPDWVTAKEVVRLRALGCTRIELGVQHTDPTILKGVNRGHDISGVKRATLLLREAGFKVDFHMMPQLPNATTEKDIAAFDMLWSDADLRPDMMKIYPCVVLKTAEIFQWWKEGRYKPYTLEELIEVLITVKSRVPRYVRISRLIRDIPADYIYDGNN
ncbi:tRNA uridine(34) 5-carboxymethylaminomethyl modification radical SAM/GNAT enzyme Elp3, partial [Candidatus Uhrbacteria bacterium]|nr:tRNA uridine(34) 5-carboxymethylaminomethyl modification radical SAM/GNAT enzyme Elp3 [Candidatus Uhrbacteria bacterium]